MPVYVQGAIFYDFPQSFGASTGIEFLIKSKLITSTNNDGKAKSKYRDLIVSGNLGFYRYPFNHSGVFLSPALGKRYNKGKPYYFEWLAGIGLLRTFYDGQVYTVNDNGAVNKLSNYGRYYVTISIATAFGYNFEKSKKPQPFAIAIKSSLWVQYPYNSFLLPHLSADLSFNYHFNKFNSLIKQKHLSR